MVEIFEIICVIIFVLFCIFFISALIVYEGVIPRYWGEEERCESEVSLKRVSVIGNSGIYQLRVMQLEVKRGSFFSIPKAQLQSANSQLSMIKQMVPSIRNVTFDHPEKSKSPWAKFLGWNCLNELLVVKLRIEKYPARSWTDVEEGIKRFLGAYSNRCD